MNLVQKHLFRTVTKSYSLRKLMKDSEISQQDTCAGVFFETELQV